MHQVAASARRRQLTQRGAEVGIGGLVIVVADPSIEQITENVKSLGLPRAPAEETEKTLDRDWPLGGQVEIGDEEGRRHLGMVGRRSG